MRSQLPLAEQVKLRDRGHDLDTVTYGLNGPFEPWEGDHTALVHILWDAHHQGLDMHRDADKIATIIMHSRWLQAERDRTRGSSEASDE